MVCTETQLNNCFSSADLQLVVETFFKGLKSTKLLFSILKDIKDQT